MFVEYNVEREDRARAGFEITVRELRINFQIS
jgi:hypothetical protein